MGAAGSCCSGDPSQDNVITTEKQPTRNGSNNKQTQGYKEELPEESQSNLNVPSNNNGYNSDDPEESLQVPSTLSDAEDPVPPSGDEEEEEEEEIEEPEKYNESSSKQEQQQQQPSRPKHRQILILEDEDLKARSVTLVTSDNNGYNSDDPEESLQVPSTLSDAEDPVPPSGDEEEEEEEEEIEEPEKYNESSSKQEQQQQQQPSRPKHRQILILEDEDLKARSVTLVTSDNNEFIKFLKKILKSKLNEKIWSKCDPNGTGRIETEKFMYFWTLPVTLFKVAVYQRKNGNKKKPKLDQKDLKKEFTHLATWIIRKNGNKQNDGGCTFTLTKENFAKNIVDYVKEYAEAGGELYDEY